MFHVIRTAASDLYLKGKIKGYDWEQNLCRADIYLNSGHSIVVHPVLKSMDDGAEAFEWVIYEGAAAAPDRKSGKFCGAGYGHLGAVAEILTLIINHITGKPPSDDGRTISTREIEKRIAVEYNVPVDFAAQAVECFIYVLEEIESCTIDKDHITMDHTDFIQRGFYVVHSRRF